MKHKILLLVDCQYDFIDGSLAVKDAQPTMKNLVNFIHQAKTSGEPYYEKIFFTVDWHPIDHCSFKGSGGVWPVHCVQHTHGAAIYSDLFRAVINLELPYHIIEKGAVKEREEYSAFGQGTGPAEFKLPAFNHDTFKPEDTYIDVAGIAYDYCVANCALDLKKEGYEVTVFGNLCPYVCPSVKDYRKLEITTELLEKGVVLEDWYPPKLPS